MRLIALRILPKSVLIIALASAGIAADPVTSCRQVKDVLAIVPATSAGSHEPFHLPVGQRQLFLDDYLIADVRDVTPKLHQPVKFGAVIRPDKPWEGNSIQVRTGPSFRQDGLWMLWYLNGYATPMRGKSATCRQLTLFLFGLRPAVIDRLIF